jgi:hypothetical protein
MGRKYPTYISVRKEHSLARYAIRVSRDSCLYDDAEDFLAKNGDRIDVLVVKLLNDDFALSRYTDPSYPL